MMLRERYAELTTAQRKALAEKAGVSENHLWQVATRWRGKRASLDLVARLAEADRALSVSDMVAEFAEPDEAAAGAA